MKITLVYPPWQFYSPSKLYPLGITYLASSLIREGVKDVSLIDLNLEITDPQDVFQRALSIVEKTKPEILGITCWTVHLPFCLEFVKRYKKKYPSVKIVLGGVHASSQPEGVMGLCPADLIVRGEGEETMVELVLAMDQNRNLEEVLGISYRKNGVIFYNNERPLIREIDRIPFPAYHLLPPIERYQPLNRKYALSILATRGCSYRCLFCSANRLWRFQRRRSPAHVLKEIEWLSGQFELGFLRFEDDSLTIKRDWAIELFRGLKPFRIPFDCLTRIDKVDPELLRLIAEAGGEGIYHGIETASERLWKVLRKGFPSGMTLDQIKNRISDEVRLGLNPTVSAMIGIPTETEEEVRRTFAFMGDLRRLGAKTQLWMMTPYPDTEAVIRYKDQLVQFDRWKELKQFDVFSTIPREAYASVIKRYESILPDYWVFKNEIREFRRMKALYLEGATKILGEVDFV